MLNTIHDVLFPHSFDGLRHHRLVAFLQDTREFLSPQSFELSLHYRKSEFDWIVLRAVCDVEAPPEAELTIDLLGVVRAVDIELIHEQKDLIVAILFSQLSQPLFELGDIHGLGEYLKVLLALLLRDGGQQSQSRLVEQSFVYSDVLFGQSPLCIYNCFPREHALVEVYDPVAIVPRHRELPLHSRKVETS